MKSIDGGKTFETRSAPHGDHHYMWFNPKNSANFINGNDGGATVNTAIIMNQPTAQFYRVITDNQTPFRLYTGQTTPERFRAGRSAVVMTASYRGRARARILLITKTRDSFTQPPLMAP